MDAAAEIDAVGAIVDLDQHCERVGDAGLLEHARAIRSATSRLISPEIRAPARPRAEASSAGLRATRPRRNTFSAPGRWAIASPILVTSIATVSLSAVIRL